MKTALASDEAIRSGSVADVAAANESRSGWNSNGAHRGPVRPAAPSPRVRDAQLLRDVERALRATGYLAWQDVHVHALDGQLVLSGIVPSYFLKQVAQTAALAVPGVNQVRNELSVHGVARQVPQDTAEPRAAAVPTLRRLLRRSS